jgi:hypothetical protein
MTVNEFGKGRGWPQAGPEGKSKEGIRMTPRILLTILVTSLFVIMSGCGTTPNCPTCGTTINGAYGVINIIPVPEHNPTGEPGGGFTSFDISWVDPNRHLDYISDRIGLDVAVIDTVQDLAVNTIGGVNEIADAGNNASLCAQNTTVSPPVDIIPPIVSVFGNFTRFGCRTAVPGTTEPFHLPGFGANSKFGGFPGAQCCASRGNGVNPMSGPDGLEVSADGKVLFVGNGSASVAVFDLTTMNLGTNPPTTPVVLATIPTGVSGDYDGVDQLSACLTSWNGEAGSSAECGDDRADEMSYDNIHHVLAIINGDPGLPFITFIDMQYIVGATPPRTPAGDPLGLGDLHCLPLDPTTPYGPAATATGGATLGQGSSTSPSTASFNPPRCILGQIYYDGAGGLASVVGGVELGLSNPGSTTPAQVDEVGGTFPCPNPSNPTTLGGVSGSPATGALLGNGIGTRPSGATYTIPCHHGPILDQTFGTFCNQFTPGTNCAGAISPAGLGGMVWNPNTGHVLLANENSIGITNVGNVDEIDPGLTDTSCGGVSCGPVVVNSYVMLNCMPTAIAQGPGNNFLVGCADHDGTAFPPNEYVIDGTAGTILAEITNVGGVDEIWYNPGDNKYYLAARDMPNGPVMGVIDAKTNLWLTNVTTNSNSHSIAVDPSTNHAFVPLQPGGICGSSSSQGCVGVYAEQ